MLESKSTGYPSIDKPWLKYYSDEAIHTSLPKMSAYQYLCDCNKDHLDSPALEYFHKTFSFRQLFQNIDRLASCFRAVGVKEGDTVVICSANTPETVYMFYALNKIGAISNMVDPRTSPAGIASYIQESHTSVVVVLDVAYSKIASITSSLEKVIVLSPVESLFLLYKTAYQLKNPLHIVYSQKVISYQTFLSMFHSSPLPPCPYIPNRCCVIEHTGGTTGTPKSVMLSNENINAVAIQSVLTGIDMKREHTWLDIMPPFIAYGIGMGLHLPLIIGMKVILIPSFDAAKFDYLIAKHRPIHMVGVPSYWETIINSKKLKHADLSYMIAPTVGGDSMDTTLEKRSNQFLQEHNCMSKIVKGYGMTEVCGGVAGTVPQKNPIGSVGIPFVMCNISIFDPFTNHELSYNQMGEICIFGPNIMLGYQNNPAATNQLIRIHPDGRKWLHTGDIGYMDTDGALFVANRIKRIIIRYDGFKIFPSLIEQTACKHPSVSSACAVGLPDPSHLQGSLPVVFFTIRGNIDAEKLISELKSLCKTDLPEYAQPLDFIPIKALPLTPIGKIDYQLLEKTARERKPQ